MTNEIEFKKELSFGKVDGYDRGVKNCPVTIELSLKWIDAVVGRQTTIDRDIIDCGYWRFSASVDVWNHMKSDVIMCGQCFDEVYKQYPEMTNRSTFAKVMKLWRRWHLNDMKPGTRKQQTFLDTFYKHNKLVPNYDDSVKELTRIGVLNHNGYKYGSAWLIEHIPVLEIKKINEVMELNKIELGVMVHQNFEASVAGQSQASLYGLTQGDMP